MYFVEPVPITTDPVPVRVAPPAAISSAVVLPVASRLMVPSLVMVPEITVSALFRMLYVPLLVTFVRYAYWPAASSMTPLPLVVSVPPVILTLFSSSTVEAFPLESLPTAWMVPELAIDPPYKTRVPPLVASRTPVEELVIVPSGWRVRGAVLTVGLMLALMVLLLTRTSSPLPRLPTPEIP